MPVLLRDPESAGLIRAARRPHGWIPPGPPPRVPAHRPEIWPRRGEDLCYLSGEWRILQRLDGHRWSLDDLVTAWVAVDECCARPPRRALDLGCGIGSVLLMVAWAFPRARVDGIEAQVLSVDLARRSLAWNGVEGRCAVTAGDFRARRGRGDCDLVTGTPPYLRLGSGTESARAQFADCHFEHRGGVEDYAAAAAAHLAPQGVFVACAGAAQDARVRAAAGAHGLAIARRVEVRPRAGKAPLFAVYVLRFAPAVERDERLVVRTVSGAWTQSFRGLRAAMGLPPRAPRETSV